ncbi:chaplin family protein [Streptomyces sp. NPDC046197]|uniref:chaplin family protein n=1 Tax=Streptomyces sp. NPDC046197 TaxID=3154337 RepID=UPI0033C69164
MRQTLSRGVFVAAAAATGILSLSCSSAIADTDATGGTSGSHGLLAGNAVQAPADVPANLCGNTVTAGAVLNDAFGNSCVGDACDTATDETSQSSTSDLGYGTSDTVLGTQAAGTKATGCQAPPATSVTTPRTPPTRVSKPPRKTTPPKRSRKTPPPARHVELNEPPQLAQTGDKAMLATSAASAALITGGMMLYRRGRVASQR